MAKDRTVTVTEADVAKWQGQLQDLHRQQVELNQKIAILHQKIQFAALMFNEQSQGTNSVSQQSQPQQQTVHFMIPQFMPHAQNMPSTPPAAQKPPKLPDVIMSLFPMGGEGKTRPEIKGMLKAKGLNNLGNNDAYFYTTMKRLVDKGLLEKIGDSYSRRSL